MPDRTCPGSCCAVFTYLDMDHPRFPTTMDADFISDMLIQLDLVSAAERLTELGPDVQPEFLDESDLFDWEGRLLTDPTRRLMTCRHWDIETRLCTVYEQRPRMCRDYPYGRTCDYGCACKGQARD